LIGDAAYNAAQTLLAYGADPNGNAKCRPLIIASGGGHARLVELLLTYSANVDIKDTVRIDSAVSLHDYYVVWRDPSG